MNELQDEICDRLMGSKLSPHWVGGLFHVAALVLEPDFTPNVRSDGRPRQYARVVGWPLVFCEAVMGISAGLPTEDDRRTLAVSLFGTIPTQKVGKTLPPMPRKHARDAAIWAVPLAHECACSADCPLHTAMLAFLEADSAQQQWSSPFEAGFSCRSAPRKEHQTVSATSSASHHAVVAIRYLVKLLKNDSDSHSIPDALREAGKAITKSKGLAAGMQYCHNLAVHLEMIPARPSE
ncbi:hypothetical protein [Tuwongella immobilis]|uniref:Uncharacterized protein n=1 Tax=Tuwongella immobilis TaxID=692036 RepID=A0A6C2YXS3_9BACT|nr:hypothetical protein [Tuwongella immobilis]VIP05565.1 unnamed protein product [Tuwongella immobilis]VTS08486.1 unnamed protein product [Tuwongella immobilis]